MMHIAQPTTKPTNAHEGRFVVFVQFVVSPEAA
jgi:hypothetical protein